MSKKKEVKRKPAFKRIINKKKRERKKTILSKNRKIKF
jgi:hypothetical protein